VKIDIGYTCFLEYLLIVDVKCFGSKPGILFAWEDEVVFRMNKSFSYYGNVKFNLRENTPVNTPDITPVSVKTYI